MLEFGKLDVRWFGVLLNLIPVKFSMLDARASNIIKNITFFISMYTYLSYQNTNKVTRWSKNLN